MKHQTLAILAFVFLEIINTVINILPALRETTPQGRQRHFIRAGIVSMVAVAGLAAYFVLAK